VAVILSIQSWVAYGHVGNAAAIFPLQRLGHEVWTVNTVQFSNHPGYGGFRGRVFDADHIAELIAGLAERGILGRCDAVLSGYLGDAATGTAVLDAVARVRAANPKALFCCDPVMGDDKPGLFVRPGIPDFFREHAVPAADILTPNRFELETLAGRSVVSLEDALSGARDLLTRGPRLVIVTGLAAPFAPRGHIATLAVTRDAAWTATTPELTLDPAPNGTGDLLAALLLGHILAGLDTEQALARAVGGLFAVLAAAHRDRLREMPIVAAQDAFVAPSATVAVERLGG
jgi:pyridoxine kinase